MTGASDPTVIPSSREAQDHRSTTLDGGELAALRVLMSALETNGWSSLVIDRRGVVVWTTNQSLAALDCLAPPQEQGHSLPPGTPGSTPGTPGLTPGIGAGKCSARATRGRQLSLDRNQRFWQEADVCRTCQPRLMRLQDELGSLLILTPTPSGRLLLLSLGSPSSTAWAHQVDPKWTGILCATAACNPKAGSTAVA